MTAKQQLMINILAKILPANGRLVYMNELSALMNDIDDVDTYFIYSYVKDHQSFQITINNSQVTINPHRHTTMNVRPATQFQQITVNLGDPDIQRILRDYFEN